MVFKYNTYYKCRTDKDVEDLWNWFNEQGGVKENESYDSLDYMKRLYHNNNNILFYLLASDSWNSLNSDEDESFIVVDNYSDSDENENDYDDIINYSPITVNIDNKIPKVNVKIDELLNGQVFISKPKDYDDVRYNFMKCDNDGKTCVLDLDTFGIYDDINMYEVVKLLNCELKNIE